MLEKIFVGSHVWVEDPELVWIDGQVLNINGEEAEIQTSDEKTVLNIHQFFSNNLILKNFREFNLLLLFLCLSCIIHFIKIYGNNFLSMPVLMEYIGILSANISQDYTVWLIYGRRHLLCLKIWMRVQLNLHLL